MTQTLNIAETYLDAAGLLDQPGAVLYSGESTLDPGPVYLLGLNPGGSEGATLRDSIRNSRAEHNCYLDEQWAPGGRLQPKGQSTLQRRVQHICSLMGLETREVPASNLAFTRSTRVATHSDFKTAAEVCLAVHRLFIDAIQPDLLITYGSIGNFAGLGQLEAIEERSAQHASWMAHRGTVKIGGRSIGFANIPHMSLWASDKRPEVMRWALRL